MIGSYIPASWRREAQAPETPLFDRCRAELRRGCLTLAALAELRREQHGYALRQSLKRHGLDVEPGTLYPLLRRLESRGLLMSDRRDHGRRKKRFYRLSTEGFRMLDQLRAEWARIDRALKEVTDVPYDGAA